MNFNRNNFHKHTFCIFKEVSIHEIKDLMVSFKSKSGSVYYYTDNGVYRLSNHWSRVANCRWRLLENSNIQNSNSNKNKLGYANWNDFFADNDFEKLYFITIDFKTNEANYFHKNASNCNDDCLLRTSQQTMKRIKEIRKILDETAWAKYYNEDVALLRKKIVEQLIQSNKTLQEIKAQFLSF